MTPQDILKFWFEDHGPKDWFQNSKPFDDLVRQQFLKTHQQATRGDLWPWLETAEGMLALVILLDQFSRNMFRNSPLAFATDAQSLSIAQMAVHLGRDQDLEPEYRKFLYMPYMHSESKLVHEQAVTLFKSLNFPETFDYELRHKAIIDQFGRYPHRNQILGRESTAAEIAFLKTEGSSF